MDETRSAAPFVPKTGSIRRLSAAVQECRGCELYKTATQAVFGRLSVPPPDSEGRRQAYESLVADLKVVATLLRRAT